MIFNVYDPITSLNGSKIKWNIRVRVQAIWKGITRESKEFRGINMILVDDCSSRIHAFINAKFCNLFEKKLEQDQIYNISNFVVQDYTGVEFHRCVRYDKHIYFADYTKVETSSKVGLEIPPCAFDFFNLADLQNMEADKRFLCDVVGIIKENTTVRDYVNDNQELKKQKKFMITDGSCSVKVTFFDDLAQSLEDALQKQAPDDIIIIISSAKIGNFQGDLTLTNYPATRFYVNYNHNVVKKLRLGSKVPGFFKDNSVNENLNVEVKTVNEIKQLKSEYIERKVICRVTVKKVEDQLQWYDSICKKCNMIINLNDGRFKCNKCGRHYTLPPRRFRVAVLCSDSSGGLPIILGDFEVRKLTGKTVFDVELDLVEGEQELKFPPILKSFVNKEYYITLKISADNVNEISDIYEACDISVEAAEYFASNTGLKEQSMEPEDDGTLTENALAETIMEESKLETLPRTIRKTRVRKTPEKYRHKDDELIRNPFSTPKIAKEKMYAKTASKTNTPKTGKSTTKKQVIETTTNDDESGDEHVSLNHFRKKKNKQGSQDVN